MPAVLCWNCRRRDEGAERVVFCCDAPGCTESVNAVLEAVFGPPQDRGPQQDDRGAEAVDRRGDEPQDVVSAPK